MTWQPRSLAARLAAAFLTLLMGYGALAAWTFHREGSAREAEALQRVSRGLASHIVAHWPRLAGAAADGPEARAAVMEMLMAVNPGVQVYLLRPDGEVADYLGPPGMVRTPRVRLGPLQAFIGGAPLPLRGTDPMGGGEGRLFSVARFEGAGAPGYLYVVLDGAARQQATLASGGRTAWHSASVVVAAGLLLAGALGLALLRRMTRPLQALAGRMARYGAGATAGGPPADVHGDEVRQLEQAFAQMTARIEAQADAERAQAAAHRETLAGLAHDLRTPLTALQGQLEALLPLQCERPELLAAALVQSERVRRLSQQLFELAMLQCADAVPLRERFRLDELVADSVGKFQLMPAPQGGVAEVRLGEAPPSAVEIEGDLQLVERALANLIDNARRHAAAGGPVTVSFGTQAGQAQVIVSDRGPGLPPPLQQALAAGEPLRAGRVRPGGGLGGLGLAIAQRIALLHGGGLRPLPAEGRGTRLCLSFPLAP